MHAEPPNKTFRPGDLAPITGVYLVTHRVVHRAPHEAVIIRGEQLPECRTCNRNVAYQILRATSHITHDWDFSGPHHLAVRLLPEEFSELRMYRRFPIRLSVRVQLLPSAKFAALPGQIRDLSAGGVGAVIREQIPKRCSDVLLKMTLEPGKRPFSMRARLRYRSGMRYGFEFSRLGTEEVEAIREFIEKQRHNAPSPAM